MSQLESNIPLQSLLQISECEALINNPLIDAVITEPTERGVIIRLTLKEVVCITNGSLTPIEDIIQQEIINLLYTEGDTTTYPEYTLYIDGEPKDYDIPYRLDFIC